MAKASTCPSARTWSTTAAATDSTRARPSDPTIVAGRLLTGYDFDVESIARAADGTLWFGEEFGP
jgi:hypothetical protein